MSLPNPLSTNKQESNQWNVLSLGQFIMPGVATVHVQNTFVYNAPKSKNQNSSVVEYQGMDPRVLNVLLVMWEPEHFIAWEKIYKEIILKSTTKENVPLSITHPQAQAASITSVYITSLNVDMPHNNDGWPISFTLLEHRDPIKTKASKKIEKNKGKTLSEQGLPPLPDAIR